MIYDKIYDKMSIYMIKTVGLTLNCTAIFLQTFINL